MKFSVRFKELRKAQGKSISAISKELRIKPVYIKDWEKKDVLPTLEVICKVAKMFGVTTDYMMGRGESMVPPKKSLFSFSKPAQKPAQSPAPEAMATEQNTNETQSQE